MSELEETAPGRPPPTPDADGAPGYDPIFESRPGGAPWGDSPGAGVTPSDIGPRPDAADAADATPPSRSPRGQPEAAPGVLWGARGSERTAYRYRLEEELGRGGMGVVYRAADRWLGRHVAVKVCKQLMPSESSLRRFEAEARVTGSLEHPGIVPVYDAGVGADGHPFYVMKLVRGRSLDRVLRETADAADPPIARHLRLFLKVCEAVAFAHAAGVVHRDLKPGNIMVAEFGEVLVVDWGLARLRGAEDAASAELEERVSAAVRGGEEETAARRARTRAGQMIGTPCYMSPEQVRGLTDVIDQRSDVYALGAILYEILAGDPPHGKRGVGEALLRTIAEPAPPPREVVGKWRRAAIPRELEAIALRATCPEREGRYGSAEELAADVRRHLEGRSVHAYDEGLLGRARKWAVRHRGAVGAACAIAAVGLATSAVWSAVLQRTEHERAEAAAARARIAEDRAADLARRAEAKTPYLRATDLLRREPGPDVLDATVRPLLEEAVAADPSFGSARLELAWLYVRLGERVAALRQFERLVATSSDEPLLHLYLGDARRSLGDLEGARRSYEAAAALGADRSDPAARAAVASLAMYEGRWTEALPDARAAAAEAPWLWEAHWVHAVCLHELGRLDEALDAYDQTLARRPEFTPALENRAALVLERGDDPERALEDLRRAQALGDHSARLARLAGWGTMQAAFGADEETAREEGLARAVGLLEVAVRRAEDQLDGDERASVVQAARSDRAVALAGLGRTEEALAEAGAVGEAGAAAGAEVLRRVADALAGQLRARHGGELDHDWSERDERVQQAAERALLAAAEAAPSYSAWAAAERARLGELRRAVRIRRETRPPERTAEEWGVLASVAWRAGRAERAVALASAAVRRLRGTAEAAAGGPGAAATAAAVRPGAREARLRALRGSALLSLGRAIDAAGELRRALATREVDGREAAAWRYELACALGVVATAGGPGAQRAVAEALGHVHAAVAAGVMSREQAEADPRLAPLRSGAPR